MTTIVWDGYTLASDSLITDGNSVVDTLAQKLYYYPAEGIIVGAAGSMPCVEAVMNWAVAEIAEGETYDLPYHGSLGFDVLLVKIGRDGFKTQVYTGFFRNIENYGHMEPIYSEPVAIGSGARFAMGAIRAGADARKAVHIAEEMDLFTGGDIIDYFNTIESTHSDTIIKNILPREGITDDYPPLPCRDDDGRNDICVEQECYTPYHTQNARNGTA